MSDGLLLAALRAIHSQSLSICCPRCESSLSMHQPDPDLPDRLLATCDECKSWFLANSDATTLVPIPRTAR